MHIKSYRRGGLTFTDPVADRPMQTVPAIQEEYMDGDTRMYLTTDGRQFNAAIYDQNFKVAVTQKRVLSDKQLTMLRRKNGRGYRKMNQG